VDPSPLRIVKNKPYAIDEGYLSYCYRLLTLLLFMPPLSGVARNMDIEVEFDFCEVGQFEGACLKIIKNMDNALWQFLMLKKDLNPESLISSFTEI